MGTGIYLFCISVGLIMSALYFVIGPKDISYRYSHKYIFFLMAFVFAFEMYAISLVNQGKPNVLVYNICFVIAETVVILWYLGIILENKKMRRHISVFILAFLGWALLNSLFLQNIAERILNYTYLLASLGISYFCVYFLFQVFNFQKYRDTSVVSIPYFWQVTAFLIFYTTSVIYFISQSITWDYDLYLNNFLGSINRIFAALMYLLLGLSFYAPMAFSKIYGRQVL
ncbi:hypothetical protein [Negadavirga shengliensis]|uniref:Histidine kinase N-terminal 7TM region domain-containing protein n=1 Tax=Negadavirga shengliensis TaxID=1389218 RepID=A0ABV9SVR2_9BACT